VRNSRNVHRCPVSSDLANRSPVLFYYYLLLIYYFVTVGPMLYSPNLPARLLPVSYPTSRVNRWLRLRITHRNMSPDSSPIARLFVTTPRPRGLNIWWQLVQRFQGHSLCTRDLAKLSCVPFFGKIWRSQMLGNLRLLISVECRRYLRTYRSSP
jgi:hypothetical protein